MKAKASLKKDRVKIKLVEEQQISPSIISYPYFYPWQEIAWQHIMRQIHQARLPHALLLTGQVGMGKLHYAHLLAASLLCENKLPTGLWCQQCKSCHLIISNNHPDLHVLMPEEVGKAIKIEQVRELISLLSETAYSGTYRIVIVTPADALNVFAANALLKVTEEPGKQTLFIFVSALSFLLPSTIRSRCQKIHFSNPTLAMTQEWLLQQASLNSEQAVELIHLSQGSPLRALAMTSSPYVAQRTAFFSALQQIASGELNPLLLAAKGVQEELVKEYIAWLTEWVMMSIQQKFGIEQSRVLLPSEEFLSHQARKIQLSVLYNYLDRLNDAYKLLLKNNNVNTHLLLEDILLQLSFVFTNRERDFRS